MTLNMALQRRIMLRRLAKLGIDAHTVDLDAILDASLTPSENWANLANHVPIQRPQWGSWQHEETQRAAAGGRDAYTPRRDHPTLTPEGVARLQACWQGILDMVAS